MRSFAGSMYISVAIMIMTTPHTFRSTVYFFDTPAIP